MAGGTASPNRRRAGDRPKGDPSCRLERSLARRGYRAVAGLDEVGRGSWAGPLVAAAVILPRPTPSVLAKLRGVRDSKQLLAAQRERLFAAIHDVALSTGIGLVSAPTIDLLGLSAAGQLALERAARALSVVPDYLLIDAFALPGLDCPQEAIIFGDARCLSIAAASVIAKVERDRLLARLALEYPAFGFERNKGYGTAEHRRVLACLGPTSQHRFGYAPVRAVLGGGCAC